MPSAAGRRRRRPRPAQQHPGPMPARRTGTPPSAPGATTRARPHASASRASRGSPSRSSAWPARTSMRSTAAYSSATPWAASPGTAGLGQRDLARLVGVGLQAPAAQQQILAPLDGRVEVAAGVRVGRGTIGAHGPAPGRIDDDDVGAGPLQAFAKVGQDGGGRAVDPGHAPHVEDREAGPGQLLPHRTGQRGGRREAEVAVHLVDAHHAPQERRTARSAPGRRRREPAEATVQRRRPTCRGAGSRTGAARSGATARRTRVAWRREGADADLAGQHGQLAAGHPALRRQADVEQPLAGRASYMPDVAITLSTRTTWRSSRARSPVTGLTPRFAASRRSWPGRGR